jgi:rRNA maturation RNase YbeY
MPVLLRSEVRPSPVSLPQLKKIAAALLRHAGKKQCELSILLVDDRRMTELNTAFRDKNKPTNVLSFPMAGDEEWPGPQLLGDIVISLDTAAREAEAAGIPLVDHLTVLLVHGLVHLLGHDHERGPEAAAAMNAMEKELLRLHATKNLAPLSG